MNLYINDISYQPQVTKAETDHLISDFIDVCDRAKSYLFEKIIVPDDYKTREIVKNFSFISYSGTAHYKDVTSEKFKSLIANQLIRLADDDLDDSIQYVYFGETDSYYLKKAYNRNVPVISFRTIGEFDNPTLEILNKHFDEHEKEVHKKDKVRNVSHSGHFVHHQQYFNDQSYEIARKNGKWDAKSTPLPRVEATSNFLTDSKFDQRWANADENYRVGLANEIGTYIAELNGWEPKSKLSGRNNRKIFKALNQSMYLSIDTLHGTFELHDRNGKHKGEYNFAGIKLENAQHNHDIKI